MYLDSKYVHVIILGLMVHIKFGIVFELFVFKIYGDSDSAFLNGTEILNSKLNEMYFTCRLCYVCIFVSHLDKGHF